MGVLAAPMGVTMKKLNRYAALGLLLASTPLLMGGCESDVDVWGIVSIAIDATLAILSLVL